MLIHYLEIVTKEVDAVCAAYVSRKAPCELTILKSSPHSSLFFKKDED
jgi:hypothetical protein